MNQHLCERGLSVEGIAQALEASKATVSRALSGNGRVSGKTKIRDHGVLLCTADEREQAQLERHLEQRKL